MDTRLFELLESESHNVRGVLILEIFDRVEGGGATPIGAWFDRWNPCLGVCGSGREAHWGQDEDVQILSLFIRGTIMHGFIDGCIRYVFPLAKRGDKVRDLLDGGFFGLVAGDVWVIICGVGVGFFSVGSGDVGVDNERCIKTR
jgi:hypothetical protein